MTDQIERYARYTARMHAARKTSSSIDFWYLVFSGIDTQLFYTHLKHHLKSSCLDII